MNDPLAIARKSADAMWANDQATRWLGMELVEIAPARAVLTMVVRPEMCNGHGTCHGGMIFTLADSAFAFACNSQNRVTVANNCSVAFVAPGRVGDRLRAEAVEVHRGGRSGISDVTVTNQDGKIVAIFRGHSTEIKGTLFQD